VIIFLKKVIFFLKKSYNKRALNFIFVVIICWIRFSYHLASSILELIVS